MYKKIILSCLTIVFGIVFLCPAAYSADKKKDKSVKIVTLSLAPAAEPVPALSYSLLPLLIDQKTGNAALKYHTAARLCPNGNSKEDINEKIRKWLDLPVEQLNRKEVEQDLLFFSSSFHQLKLAAQCNYCNWEMPIEDGFSMVIPDLAEFRYIIRALQLQIRLNIMDGKIDQTLELMREGFYMGRCIAEGPTLIQNLVGIALESMMLKEAEEIAGASKSPNLYWALTLLPNPLINMHTAIQFEHETIFMQFPQLRNLENEKLTPTQALKIVTDFLNTLETLGAEGNNAMPINLLPAAWTMMHYADAKKYLAEKGFSKERIEEMPTAQAVLIYQKQQYMSMSDNIFKWLNVPYYQSYPHLIEGEKQLSTVSQEGPKMNIFSSLLPALYRVALLQARLERNVALLRTIEAMRMFAAEHSGQLPENLEKITSVPIPTDPVTGKQFIYQQVDKQNARLEAPVEPGSEENQQRPVYILSIKK